MVKTVHLSQAAHLSSRSLRGVTIGFIGAGTMGQALIKGLLAQGVSPRRIVATEPNAATRRRVSRDFAITVTADIQTVVRRADVVVLAVKPQQFPEVIAQLEPILTRRHLVMSIAAGITLRWLQTRLPSARLVRVMPNLPATLGRGFSAMAFGRRTTPRHRAIARALFGAVGEVCELPERYFDAVTAVSGSGPAYLFFLAQAWETAARALGLPASVAARAIRATLEGSTRLLLATDEPASALIQKVASKRGTTEAALRVLARRRVSAHFTEALRAAARRSRELSWS